MAILIVDLSFVWCQRYRGIEGPDTRKTLSLIVMSDAAELNTSKYAKLSPRILQKFPNLLCMRALLPI